MADDAPAPGPPDTPPPTDEARRSKWLSNEAVDVPVWHRHWFQSVLAVLIVSLLASFILPPLFALLYAARSVLVPVLLGLGLAYVFNPLVSWMHRSLRMPRWLGTSLIITIGTLLAALIIALAAPIVYNQVAELASNVRDRYPKVVANVMEAVRDAAPGVPGEPDGGESAVAATQPAAATQPVEAGEASWLAKRLAQELDMDPTAVQGVLARVGPAQIGGYIIDTLDFGVGFVGSALSLTTYLILLVVVAGFCFFFFSWKLPDLAGWFVPFIPEKHRGRTLELLGKMNDTVSAFVRGRLVQSFVVGVVLTTGWGIASVPYWLLLGVLGGVLNLVPYLPVVGGVLAVIVSVVDALAGGGLTFGAVLWPAVVYLVAQTSDNYLVEPLVQGKATDLDPLTVLIVVLLGGALLGLLGMILAIPTAACIKILAKEVVLPRLREAAMHAGKGG